MAIDSKSAAFYADFGGLATLKGAAKAQDPKALREAARQFEGLFTQMMLKSMRQASTAISGGDSLMDNDQSNMYREMFDNQLAVQLSKGRGLGLADVLVRQLSQSGLVPDASQPDVKPAKTDGHEPMFKLGKQAVKSADAKYFSINEHARALAIDLEKPSKASFPLSPSQWPAAVSAPPAVKLPLEPKPEPAVVAPIAPMPSKSSESVAPKSLADLIKSIVAPGAPKDSVPDAVTKATSSPSTDSPRQPLAKDAADFVRQMWPHAQKAARELGVDAKTLIAHAALETGWGKFVPCNPDGTCSFNLFGIKATGRWQGASTAVNTLEYEDGVAVKKRESFRTYDSPADSFRDYAAFIKSSPRYSSAVGAGGDAAAFATALQNGGYATDPNYAAKLTSVASRLGAMTPKIPLKLADNQPLTTGRSVSGGDGV